jgi:hypothetical protein
MTAIGVVSLFCDVIRIARVFTVAVRTVSEREAFYGVRDRNATRLSAQHVAIVTWVYRPIAIRRASELFLDLFWKADGHAMSLPIAVIVFHTGLNGVPCLIFNAAIPVILLPSLVGAVNSTG